VFSGAWKIAQFFFSERTSTKINVLRSSEQSWEPKYKFMPRELLPLPGRHQRRALPA
jgi:hypothetical protein